MATLLEAPKNFENEAVRTFAAPDERAAMSAAIDKVRRNTREYELVIGGQRVKSASQFNSINPAKPAEVIGRVQAASVEQAQAAVAAAEGAFARWSRETPRERTQLLFRAADAVRKRRNEFVALLVLE